MTTQQENISLEDAGVVPTRYWHKLEDGRIQCDLARVNASFTRGNGGFVSYAPASKIRLY